MKKRIYLWLMLLMFFSFAAISQPEAEEVMALTESVDLGPLQPLQEAILPVVKTFSALVGGIFGLYLILILVRIYYERKNFKVLKEIKTEIEQLNKNLAKKKKQEK